MSYSSFINITIEFINKYKKQLTNRSLTITSSYYFKYYLILRNSILNLMEKTILALGVLLLVGATFYLNNSNNVEDKTFELF